MNWSDYEAVWKRQPLPVGASADVQELRAGFEAKRRKLAANLQVRDWSELAAAGFLVFVYLKFWVKVGAAGWPMIFAILFILVPAVFFVRERLRVRRQRLGPDASLLAKVEADLAELQHQRQLLRNIWYWYLAPCCGAGLVHLGVIMHVATQRNPGAAMPFAVACVLLVGTLFVMAGTLWLVARLNRRVVEKKFEPRIAELEKLRHDLIASSTP